MKETYFKPENIREKAIQLRSSATGGIGSRMQYAPDSSALLVLDMQRYFLDKQSHAFVPSAPAIIPNLVVLIDAYRQRDLSVVFTRHVNDLNNAGMMGKWWKDIITDNGPLSEIDSGLEVREGELLDKSQYDAFLKTDLEVRLKERGVTQVVICGVMTHLCCETTARSAFMRGFEVFFAVDGTATYNEAFHKATLLNLSHGFADPVLVDELLGVLKND